MLPYNFSVVWLEGKANSIADALSRNPLREDKHFPINNFIIASSSLTDEIINQAKICLDYKSIVDAFKNEKVIKNPPSNHPARSLIDIWHSILVCEEVWIIENKRIFIPKAVRPKIIALLHEGHTGISATIAAARWWYYWPGLKNNIINAINKCEACQMHWPSLKKDTEISTNANYPMQQTAVDLFEYKNRHYMMMVDRYLGFPWVKWLHCLSSENVIETLRTWFLYFGFPQTIHSDGGPQFRIPFILFCKENGIIHENSSPYNSRSNGLTEVFRGDAFLQKLPHLWWQCSQVRHEDGQLVAQTKEAVESTDVLRDWEVSNGSCGDGETPLLSMTIPATEALISNFLLDKMKQLSAQCWRTTHNLASRSAISLPSMSRSSTSFRWEAGENSIRAPTKFIGGARQSHGGT